MQHKFLLRFIKEEMEKAHIVAKSNEDFFRLFLKDEPWSSYRSNMSNWLSAKEDGVIRKRIFISAINEKLGLGEEVWGASEGKQKEAVVQGVLRFKEELEGEEIDLFPCLDAAALSPEQEAFLDFAKSASLETLEKRVQAEATSFEKRSQNQPFLLALFHIMYARAAYVFVYDNVFPYLLDTYDNTVKAKQADIYASLPTPMYREAFEILSAIKGENKEETIDLKTAAISNIRRERLSSATLSKEEFKGLLQTLIRTYVKIYVPKEGCSYYPGINLAYLLALEKYVFPNEESVLGNDYSVKQIYADVKNSITKEKTSETSQSRYYALMSDIEFQLLLNKQSMVQELEYVLETENPSQSLVNQTQRQMGLFFMDLVERFS
ncbi:MAG: hypothetical protein GQ531_05565, partial [Sulfurovum sp.]|nr:hypothetical protein [Sulfurovum sp.]